MKEFDKKEKLQAAKKQEWDKKQKVEDEKLIQEELENVKEAVELPPPAFSVPTLPLEEREKLATEIFKDLSDEDAKWIWNRCIDLFLEERDVKYHYNRIDSSMSDYKKHMIK